MHHHSLNTIHWGVSTRPGNSNIFGVAHCPKFLSDCDFDHNMGQTICLRVIIYSQEARIKPPGKIFHWVLHVNE